MRAELPKVHTSDYLRSLREPEAAAWSLEVSIGRRLPEWTVDWYSLSPRVVRHRQDDPDVPAGPEAKGPSTSAAATPCGGRPRGRSDRPVVGPVALAPNPSGLFDRQ